MAIQAANPFGAFIAGRQARQDEEYGNTRNALARQDLETGELRNRMVREQYSQEQIQRALQQTAATASRLAQSPNVRAELQQYPEFISGLRQQLPELDQMQDEELRQYLGFVAGQAQSRLGIGPASPEQYTLKPGEARYSGTSVVAERQAKPAADTGFTLSPGARRYGPDGKLIAAAPDAPKPASQFTTLTPEEVARAGLPAGTAAQRDNATGKIDVLSKRDTTATLNQKDATTVKNKLTTLRVARKQLEDIRNAFAGIQGTLSAGAFGQGKVPSEAGRKFDAAVGRMRSTLTALTRVPGVGAMSDYETKLDQQKFPDRANYESVTADQIQGVEDLLTILERGYSDLLSGGTAQAPQQAAPAAGGWTIEEVQ